MNSRDKDIILLGRVRDLAREYHADVISLRRHLHQHPELSFEEVETAKFVSQTLSSYGIAHTTGIGGHGIVALIQGEGKGSRRCMALRADMDALPIAEANDVPYKSQRPGVMHACGHDAHTASMLGAARILHKLRPHFAGQIKILFQPGEEKLPGGASLMIRDGALRKPRPAGIIGQHVHTPLPAGAVGFRAGMYMASSDEIYLSVRGKGGHGAMPHDCIDPVAISAYILTALQQLVSRYAEPTTPSVLTFGKINSTGGATNVIPAEVRIEGTFRTMNERWRAEALKRIVAIARDTAKGMGGACEARIVRGYPMLYNHETLTTRVRAAAERFLGPDRVFDLPARMTSEDFAHYTYALPGCFYRLGTGNPDRGIVSQVHAPTFDIDEDSLYVGAGLPAWAALELLCADSGF